MKLTIREARMLALLAQDQGLYDPAVENEIEVERKSDREFDLRFSGKKGQTKFSAWMVLSAIAALTNWTTPEVANLTDYPGMARSGDWSGVRDTNEESLWTIFTEHCVPQLDEPV